MTTADWAIIISLASFVLALSSFAWSVWATFIHPMPKARVSFQIVRTVGGQPQRVHKEAVQFSITNLGPNAMVVSQVVARTRHRLFAKDKATSAIIFSMPNWPYEDGHDGSKVRLTEKRLEVGEDHWQFFPLNKD